MTFRYLLGSLLAIGMIGSAQPSFARGFQDHGAKDFPKLDVNRDWPWWRGPHRDGSAIDQQVPLEMSDTKNQKWSAKIPGRGHGSPTVVGNRIFLETADEAQQIHAIVCLDRESGKQLWLKQVNQGGFPARNHAKNTEATPTIASDGELLFATFYHHDGVHAVAMDLEGKERWNQKIGNFRPKMFEYGYAPSPLLYRDMVIICAEYDGDSFLTAIDAKSGQAKWRTPRPSSISFSSPVVAHLAGKDQLLLSGINKVCSFDPMTGTPLWDVDGTTFATCGTMIWENDVAFASGGFPKKETLAVKTDGSGTVLWRNDKKCYEQSMIVYQGFVYAFTDDGILFCWDAQTGKEMWKKRLRGPVSASPVRVKDVVFWSNEAGTMYVFRTNPKEFELLKENQIGEEGFASPAVCGNQFFIRTATGHGSDRQEYLLCFELARQ